MSMYTTTFLVKYSIPNYWHPAYPLLSKRRAGVDVFLILIVLSGAVLVLDLDDFEIPV